MSSANHATVLGIRDEVAQLKRERIVAVAAELFYERGYEHTSLEAVAERMGVTKPFIYAQFASKAELLAEICARGIAAALAALDSVLNLPGTPTERLAEVGRRFVTAVLHNQRYIAIFSREEKNLLPADFRRIGEMRRDFDRKLVALLQEGVEAGEFRLRDVRLAALAIGGMVSWAYVWFRSDGRLSLEQASEELAALILGMAQAGEAAPRAAQGNRAAQARTRAEQRAG